MTYVLQNYVVTYISKINIFTFISHHLNKTVFTLLFNCYYYFLTILYSTFKNKNFYEQNLVNKLLYRK